MDESTRLLYISSLPLYTREIPYYVFEKLPPGYPYTNIEYTLGPPQLIRDVRGREEEFGLDTHGFVYKPFQPPSGIDYGDEEALRKKYFPVVEGWLKDLLGGQVVRAEVFDFRQQRARAMFKTKTSRSNEQAVQMRDATLKDYGNPDVHNYMAVIPPVPVIHADQSPAGVLGWMHRNLQDVDSLIAKYRVRLFTVWRPITPLVEDVSLTVCDARTSCRADFLEVEFVDRTVVRRNYMAMYSDKFEFYYQSRMTDGECCVFKVFDSDAAVPAKCVPHGAFTHALPHREGTVPRRSIEVRFLVFSEV
ncbi:hypothetical protein BZA05DRAFT_452679 [Tricharina praecox]|uniref:uncharacterized protein n=1 Tax=Tricharina praecox TaxID=43433 RepID=UPI002220D645|nr:uncharacterized protein BZA05DRAFT_452679 [Tricharina praecox]KAI5851782.1 hypothetical protein BZA05DRAFT_452679 [Tricharina praecox]